MTHYDYNILYHAISEELIPDDDPLVCKIYNMLTDEEISDDHNCLGCNLAERTWSFSRCIQGYAISIKQIDEICDFDVMGSYFGWLNIIVEGICDTLSIIGISKELHSEYFTSFKTIKRWANFYKHPKAMMLTHHPRYFFDGEKLPIGYIIVNTQFVERFYGGDKRNNELYKCLQNKPNVAVVFPDPVQLVKDLRADIEGFLDILNSKPFKSKLRELSTFENYWAPLEEADFEEAFNIQET